ncbi:MULTISPECIES: trypsin-like serine peptidase [Xanthomonas]|uniref:Trypsin-like peptidase domain-containing protein n=1 Tax=Xanthomonas cucurbitae TaxID=56453 RepID=A0ABY7Y9M7_9XANT|nr:trypsin-like peptidase domain-containing protein [Xanthomonas cucurbitae]QHG87709.1 serine protease [Xanthomonas cucurbitae]WDM66582.1 trypsin-like peptidase domain-containing protein [Xanthomonas cucurbitae]WDM70461.1 trypsin-like peptidase domain-containing protein [Xanthomonas cucurbitae]WDM74327.1 trypsin-like peptidase domain-containing protein [Xanthomonas cucurbitae]WDM80218.1 trypsin-like peptidase domain-containing protein [Xanthomonas cucurbitae]
MNRKNALYLALFSAVSGSALAVPPTEMDAAPVSSTPQAARLGAAVLQSATLRGGILPTRVARLAAPTSQELGRVRERRIAQVKHGQPLQIGFSRALKQPSVNLAKLDWQMAGDGSRVATLELSSAQAASLRAALVLRGTGATPGDPSRVTLRFAGNDGRVFEQSGASFMTAGDAIGWSPTVNGDTLLVELSLPAGLYPENFSLSVPQLSHLDISPTASTRDMMTIAIGESDSCQNDVACRANPTAGFTSATKAVARMVFTTSQGSFLCTGTLLNNTNTPKRNLFWTAAHCINTQTVANTLQTYWFYDAAQCNGNTVSSQATTLSGGAFLRHANTTRDTALLELKTAPPSGAFYAAWNSAAIGSTNTSIVGIHHPSGDVKKYSLGTVNALNASIDGKSPLYRVVWNDGVTEGGSSGSGLFTIASGGAYQLRGGLYGGMSFCTAQSDPDYYSRFSDVYPSISSFFGQ